MKPQPAMRPTPTIEDRLAIRERPESWPVMYQSWGNLLFMHWCIDAAELRPHLPAELEIDTFDDSAWIAITPFALWNVRPIFVPPIPFVSEFLEVNVRTYVHYNNVPGVWFFSLDANSSLAVMGARLGYSLPYFNAEMSLGREGNRTDYRSSRTGGGDFKAKWTIGDECPMTSVPGSLEFFLTERYCLYAKSSEHLYRARIHHKPWPLRSAELESYSTDLFEADGLPKPSGEPIVHAAEAIDVEIWLPKRISRHAKAER